MNDRPDGETPLGEGPRLLPEGEQQGCRSLNESLEKSTETAPGTDAGALAAFARIAPSDTFDAIRRSSGIA